jgi:hypothetical protein
MRDTGPLLRTLAWLERQRGGVGFEVFDPVPCPESGRWRRLGFTLEADRWGRLVDWVQVLAWRVVERKERGGRESWQDFGTHGLVSLSLSLFLSKFSNAKHAWAFPGWS